MSEAKEVKFESLRKAAKELNIVVKPNPLIKLVGVTRDSIIQGIGETVPLLDPAEGDTLSSDTAETIRALGLTIPEGIKIKGQGSMTNIEIPAGMKISGPSIQHQTEEDKSIIKDKPTSEGKPRKTKSKKREEKYTRFHALVDALSVTGVTKKEMTEKANKLYIKNGGTDNMHVTCSLLGKVLPVLLLLNVVRETGNGMYQKI